MEQKATQKERVSKKYGALISYYTEVWALAYNTVSSHPVLSTLDPMGKKTTTTTLFLRACSRMDKTRSPRRTGFFAFPPLTVTF